MACAQTLNDLGISPEKDFPFSESFFPKLQRSFAFFKAHPQRKEILESGVDQTIKLCKIYPSLSFLLASKESLKSKLVHIFKQIFFSEEKGLCENGLIAFYLQKEHEFIVKLSHGNYVISLFGFLLLVKEFSEFLEHLSALEVFQKIEKEAFGEANNSNTLFKDFIFKGFSFDFFLKVKVFFAQLIRLFGESKVLDLTKEHQLDDYLDQFHNFKGIKHLFSLNSAIETPKFILKNIRAYSIFKSGLSEIDLEIEGAGTTEMFSIDRLLLNLSNQNTSEKLQPELVPEIIRSPTEAQQEQLIQLFSRKLFEHQIIEKHCIALAKDNLRFFTFPTIEGKHKLSIFHKDYCIKRVQSLNPKQASFRLLQRILKTYHKRLILFEQLHINTRQSFQEFIKDFLYKGCGVPEEKFAEQSDQVKKLNRRWNKAFLKASELTSETFLAFYTSFVFEEAAKRAFLENSQDIYNEVKETLFVQNLPSALKINTPANFDRAICTKSKEKVVIVELQLKANSIQFTFFKGLKKKKEIAFAISRIEHELKDIELANDESLTNLLADFSPSLLLIIADSKESYYLRNKMGLLVSKTASQPKPFESKIPAFVFFYNEPLAETLSLQKSEFGGIKGQSVYFYNMVFQSPMMAMLCLFSKSFMASNNPLFKSGKRVLDNDFMLFVIKMILKESIFENGLTSSDLFDPVIGKTLQTLLGILTGEELSQIRQASELNNKETLFLSSALSPDAKSMLNFLKLEAPSAEVVDFNSMKIPTQKAHEYLLIVQHLYALPLPEILLLRESAHRALYKPPGEDQAKDISILEAICGKEAFMSKVVFLKNAINDLYPKLNSKFQSPQRKSVSAFFEEKLLNSLFRTSKNGIRPGCIVEFKVRDIDLKMIRGKIGEHFSGLLMLENIGSRGRTKIEEGELDRFFSKNETIKGVVKKVFPSILRADLSIADQDLANVRNYLSKFSVLKNFGLENNINFVIDNEKDVPVVPQFVLQERNFDFVNFTHPKVLNLNLRDAKNLLRENKKIDFLMKPSPRLQKSSLDLIIFFPKHELFDILPINCAASWEEESHGVISLKSDNDSNPEKMSFVFGKSAFSGIGQFIGGFVNMLIVNLTTIYADESYTNLPKSLILQTLQNKLIKGNPVAENQNTVALEGGEPRPEFLYFVSKDTFKPLTFNLYYTDKSGETGSKPLQVNHEGFVFLLREYVTLGFLIKDVCQRHRQEEFLHKGGEENGSVKSFLTEVIDSASNISIVSNEPQANFNRNESVTNNNNNNNEKFNRANFRDNNDNNFRNNRNFSRQEGEKTSRGFGNYNKHVGGNQALTESTFPSAPIQETVPTWGLSSDAPVPDTLAPVSWGANQNANNEARLTVTDSWGLANNNSLAPTAPRESEKPARNNSGADGGGWGGNQNNSAPSWGENQNNERPSWQANAFGDDQSPKETNSSWGGGKGSWGQNASPGGDNSENRGFNSRGRGFANRGNRGFSNNSNFNNNSSGNNQNDNYTSNRGGERIYGQDNKINQGRSEPDDNRGQGANFGTRGRGGHFRQNNDAPDNFEQRKPWERPNFNNGNPQNENSTQWGDNSGENRDSNGRGGFGGRGRGGFRGGFRGRGENSGDNFSEQGFRGRGRDFSDRGNQGGYRGRAEGQGNRFGATNNSEANASPFEAPQPSWGQPAQKESEPGPTWGNPTTTEAAPSWGQPAPGNLDPFPDPSKIAKPRDNAQTEVPSWGANANDSKSPDHGLGISTGWGVPAETQPNPKSQTSPLKSGSWGASTNQNQSTNNFSWGINENNNNNNNAENNRKPAPAFENTWGTNGDRQTLNAPSDGSQRQPSWGGARGGNDFRETPRHQRGGDRGFGDRNNQFSRGCENFRSNNPQNFSESHKDQSNENSQGAFNDNTNDNFRQENQYRGGFNNRRANFNDTENGDNGHNQQRGFGSYRGRGGGMAREGSQAFDRGPSDRGNFRERGEFNRGRGRGGNYGQSRGRGGFGNHSGENSNTGETSWRTNANPQNEENRFETPSWGNVANRSPKIQASQVESENSNKGWGLPSQGQKVESNEGGWGVAKFENEEPGKRGVDSFVGDKADVSENFSWNKRTKEEGPVSPKNLSGDNKGSGDWGTSGWQ